MARPIKECDFTKAQGRYSPDMNYRREDDYRLSLYRAIYAGDISKVREIVDMMAMINIDRDQIEAARRG